MRPWVVSREAATSIIVYGEVVEFIKSDPDFLARRAALRTLLREVRPYPLSYSIMERYAELRRAMRPPHGLGLIGDMDTLLAATALEYGLTLVTLYGDFARVPDLAVLRLDRATLV
jgi:predicted nucleic acid-binding protein